MQDIDQQVAGLREDVSRLQGQKAQDAREIIALAKASMLPGLQVSDHILSQMQRLMGTTSLEALLIVSGLQQTQSLPGDVCEFGVAQGRTSGLIGLCLLEQSSTKSLWLYDSFEGLPAPTGKDVLLHDLYGLGHMGAYKGALSIPEMEVRSELKRINFPETQTRIVKGWIEDQIVAGRVPGTISFAFLDMDFYRSTKDVLNLLIERMPRGGVAVVDDYGFFSQGVETAVQEIMNERPSLFRLTHPFGFKYAVLTKIG